MNEEELKKIWQADRNAPTIEFAALQKSLTIWHDKLHRKVRIDVWAQGIAAALTLIPVFFYPKMIFLSVFGIVLGAWYIRELRGLYQSENNQADGGGVKQSLNMKILTMKNYFRRTRIAMYVFSPLAIPAFFYGLGSFDKSSMTFAEWTILLIKLGAVFEIIIFIATEIYFKVVYTPALNELENLLRQLESDG